MTAKRAGATERSITVAGHRYTFEMHPHVVGPTMTVTAPGVAPFDVQSVDEARDILRSVYEPRANS